MRLVHTLILAGALGTAACAPGTFVVTEFTAVEAPLYADAYGPVVVQEPYGYVPRPLYARPSLRYGYGSYDPGFRAHERRLRELEWRQRREFAREQRLGPLFERPPGSRRDPFAGPRSDAFRNQTRAR